MIEAQIQIVYLSFATRKFKMNVAENMKAIIKEAQANNSQHNITGQLIYRSGAFVQLLEGNKDEVLKLLGKIACDNTRHENLTVLFSQKMEKRVNPDSSMAYMCLDDQSLDIVNSIIPWQKIVRTASTGNPVPVEKIIDVFQNLGAELDVRGNHYGV